MSTDNQAHLRLPSLTGMRVAAALLVFLFHSSTLALFANQAIDNTYLFTLRNAAFLGVSFFFVLSGFGLTWSAREDDTPGRFWRRRFFKIYPSHVVTLVLALVLITAIGGPITGVVPNLLLVHSWFPQFQINNGGNPVSWSLACQAFFYLCFPFLIAGVRRIRQNRLWWWAGGTTLAVILLPLLAMALFPIQGHAFAHAAPGAPIGYPVQLWFVHLFPPVTMLQFLLGTLLARLVRTGQWVRVPMWVAGTLLLVGYLASLFVQNTFDIYALTILPLALLIPAAATADLDGTRSPLRGRLLVRLGRLQFAFYLVHMLVLLTERTLLGYTSRWSVLASIGLILLGLLVSGAAAWVLHRTVERPISHALGTSRKSRAPRALDPAPAT